MDNFIVTTALKKIFKSNKRKVICSSGTSCGKTVSIIAILIDYAARYPKLKILCVAETVPAVKSGCVNIFKDIMEITNRWVENRFNNTDRIYTFANGSTIQFSSFDTIGKAKVSGKRNILFLNEANHIPFSICNELMVRTSDKIFVDFNPSEECWIHTDLLNDEDSELIHLMFDENEALDENTKKELLARLDKAKTSEYWKNWCEVYIYGRIGNTMGAIFKDIKILDFIPDNTDFIGYGMDFGFSNDPTTITEVWKWNDNYIFNEVLYQTQMTNIDIIKFIKENNLKGLIVADSSEPKSIEEIKRAGINITGAIKGKDSVNNGIDLMLRSNIYCTSNSLNIIKEFRNYCWLTDNNGKSLNTPIDEYNHSIDGIRYLISYLNIKTNKNVNRVF
jgi:phage terminase large subunit